MSMSEKQIEPEIEGTAATHDDAETSRSEKEVKEEILVAVDVYDTQAVWVRKTLEWTKKCSVPTDCQLRGVCICEVPEGFVLLGGKDDNEISSRCWRFSFSTSLWERRDDMSIVRWCVSAAVVEGLLLAAGGIGRNKVVDVCERMDLTSGEWSPAKSLPCPMTRPLVAAAAGHVYIMGVFDFNFSRYDPITDSHTPIAVPDIVRKVKGIEGCCMVSHNEKVYQVGGRDRFHVEGQESLQLALEYDPGTQNWVQLKPPSAMYCESSGCCAVTWSSKMIVLCGGNTEAERRGGAVMEAFERPDNEWKQLDVRLPFKFYKNWCHVLKYRK